MSTSFQTGQANNKEYIHSCFTVALKQVLHFGRAECGVFLPLVLPVKLWKGQMGSGGQFLHYLNTQNCVGCLQWSGGAGASGGWGGGGEVQNDRLRSLHKGRKLWAKLWWGTVRPCPGSLIHYLFVCLCTRATHTHTHQFGLSVCWCYKCIHSVGPFCCCRWSSVTV